MSARLAPEWHLSRARYRIVKSVPPSQRHSIHTPFPKVKSPQMGELMTWHDHYIHPQSKAREFFYDKLPESSRRAFEKARFRVPSSTSRDEDRKVAEDRRWKRLPSGKDLSKPRVGGVGGWLRRDLKHKVERHLFKQKQAGKPGLPDHEKEPQDNLREHSTRFWDNSSGFRELADEGTDTDSD